MKIQKPLSTFKKYFSPYHLYRGTIFYYWKILRNQDDIDRIARGFAFGFAVSFVPLIFIGFHVLLTLTFAIITRANFTAGAIGTLFGNPFTFPLIWWAVHKTGTSIIGKTENVKNLSNIIKSTKEMLINFDFSNSAYIYETVLEPMIVGCIPYFIISYIVIYKACQFFIKKYRTKKTKFLLLKAKKRINSTIKNAIEVEKKALKKRIKPREKEIFLKAKQEAKKKKK